MFRAANWVALLLLGALTPAVAAPHSGAPQTTPAIAAAVNPLVMIAVQNENPNSNYVAVQPEQALLDAVHFTYIMAHPIAYQGQVGAMKAVNPSLRILAYENAVFAQSWEATSYPDSWYLRDASGNKVQSYHSGNYLMNPADPGWVQNRIQVCQTLLSVSGYDGCYLDVLGLGTLRAGYVTAMPIDPSSGQVWVKSTWLHDTTQLGGQVHTAISPALVIGNGLTNGALYFASATPTKPLLDAMDGALAESWLRGSAAPISAYPSESAWLADVNMLVSAESEGKAMSALVKIGVATTKVQRDSWRQYSMASFLMGTQGRSAFFFSPGSKWSRTSWHPWSDTLIGPPTGANTKITGANGAYYQRQFQNGVVFANPTMATVIVPLNSTYYTLDRQPVTSSTTMGPNSGLVLTNQLTPVTSVISGPPTPTTNTSATIDFSSDISGSTFMCAFDGGQPQACASPTTYNSLAEGAHIVTIQATSPTGIVGATTPASWDIDITPPQTTINSGPPNPTGSSSATFLFASSKPASSFTCALDSGLAQTCTSPWTVPGMLSGSHSMVIVATDPYGVRGPPSTWNWSVL